MIAVVENCLCGGNIGIGTDNPGLRAHIFSTANADAALIESTQNFSTLRFKSATNTSGPTVGIDGGGGLQLDQKDTSKYIAFSIGSERLRILNDGKVRVPDGGKFVAGAGDDLQIYHDGNHSYIDDAGVGNLYIRGGDAVQLQKYTGENFVKCIADGTVQLYYDNSKKLETTNTGVDVTGEVQCDSLDVDGVVDIDGSKVTYDSSNGLKLADSTQLRLGTGNDLRLYHDGTNSSIANHTGRLIIRNNTDDEDINLQTDDGSGGITSYIRCDGSEGSVIISHYGNTKLETTATGIDVTGNTETDDLTVTGTAYLNGTVSAASTTGTNGQVLQTTGVGVTWATLPSARTTTTITAAEDQTSFAFNYNVGFLDVFYNGVKLANTEFTASNGTSVVLGDVAYAGDIVELVSYNTVSTGGGGGGASNLNDLADVTITGSPVIGETLTHNGTKFVNDYTATTTTTATTQVSILSLDLSVYRSVEYQIQVTEGSNYHTTKILAIHNGTAASHNEFGTLSIGTAPATFDVDISGSNMRLLATPASSNSTVFKVKFTGIKV